MGLTHLNSNPFETLHDIYLEYAQQLPDSQWQIGAYEALDEALDLIEDGQDDEAEELLAELEAHVREVVAIYLDDYLGASQLSVLGMLAHKWVQEALEHLLAAISVVYEATSLEEAESSLELAEWGCRLLVVVDELSFQQESQLKQAA